MGKLFSKHSSKTNKSESVKLQNTTQSAPEQEQYEIYDPDKYDLEAVELLRREFKEDPEMFILNMLLMSFMFFDNYQEEMRFLANTTSDGGKRVNSQLIQDHQKQLLMPDSVLERVNKKVKFQPSHGPNKGKMEPLTSQRMFILHHTIEIEDEDDIGEYSRIDKPTYRAEILESRDNRGFVKVLLETSRKNSQESENRPPSADSAYSTSSTKIYRRKSEVILSNKNDQDDNSTVGAHGNDSGFSTGGNSESSYGYSRITAAKTPRRLYISEKDVYTNINQLPSKCITPIKVRNEENLDSDDDEDNEDYRNRENNLFRTDYFLNSIEFMSHFKNNIFPNYLGEILKFTDESIKRAMSIPGAILCDDKDETRNIKQWEVIPAIPMPWPGKIAFEWTLRRRRTVWDKREEKPIAYKWPTEKMIEDANKLDCVVIPKGFMPKKGENSNMVIEWEVGFPKAERYLQFRMSHAQMRLFLYIITLHKNFIEPLTQRHGLIIEHIRILMLWECEANYKAWPEDKLGRKLKLVLENLYGCMSKSELNHYFIKSRNVFENIPRKYLIPAQDIIHRIIETPLPYVLSALKHLKYTTETFYAIPNLDKLYEIMTMKNVLHREVQLDIFALEKAKQQEEAKRRREKEPNRRKDKSQEWNRRYLEQQKNANKRKLMTKTNNLHQSKNLKTERRESTESINLNFSVKNLLVNDFARQISLLTFFIDHFILIAEKSFETSTTNQTLFYLKQAWYLTILLKDIDCENAIKSQKKIKKHEENCLKKQFTEPKIPSTPKRNSTMFGNDILHVKGKDINIYNLNKSYLANEIANSAQPSTSGIKKKLKAKQNLMEPTKEPPNEVEKSINSEPMPSSSGIKNNLPPSRLMRSSPKPHRSEKENIHHKNSLYHEDVELRKHSPKNNRLIKSVSFRSQGPGADISDDEAETTSL